MLQVAVERQLVERSLGQTGDLQEFPREKKEAAWTRPGDWGAGSSHFCDPHFTVLTLVLPGIILKSPLYL